MSTATETDAATEADDTARAFAKFSADHGVQRLATQLSDLSFRDDWPSEKYAVIEESQAVEILFRFSIADYETVREWVDAAVAESDISAANAELWDGCLCELTDWLEERHEHGRLLDAIKATGHRWRPDIEIAPQAFLDDLDDDETEDLNEWLDSVHDTLASGGDLTANGGDLLTVPECLRTVVEPIEPVNSSEPAPAEMQQPPRAETPAEARQRLEEMLPIALRQLRDAESLAESRKKLHDAAKKNVDAMQGQLNSLVDELSEALTGVAGGDFQTRLPFDRVESAGQSEDMNAEAPASGVPVEHDPIVSQAVHLLTREQLSVKTNGRSGEFGITDAIADKLVDNGINTIGNLESRMRTGGGSHWYRDLNGIGKGKAEQVCDALEALRKCFPQNE